jgi:hypothetical protein
MSIVERIGNLDGEIEQSFRCERLSPNSVLQSLAFQKLHGDEGLSFVLPNLVNGADVGMIEG